MEPRPLPSAALLLGLAGLLPFLACGLAVASLDRAAGAPFMAALIGYGAVVLAFLGAVQWGLVLGGAPLPTDRRRLALGVAPALIGWLALLAPLVLPAEAGLGALILGFAATIAVESRFGWLPPGYAMLRWGLSAVVLAVLITVLTLRLLGATIIF
ncbi:MAG: DUF3429 domain-containing protein [Rhodospirillales bacterium]|nr:DUF3429 domain-containing protein [Rhodospirillales bacterium]MDE2576522.1 DUF3429 domain-containing protein [Rhodospirillales bacterium]